MRRKDRTTGKMLNIEPGASLMNANLEGANLSCAILRDANLSHANLSDANLSDTNLEGANLSDANLEGANLRDANLEGANLSDANLEGANLRDANLSDANLSDANLEGASLMNANLEGVNLSDANLEGANLSYAYLSCADLNGANLSGAKGLLNPSRWMEENFESVDEGYVVYKRIGSGWTQYTAPKYWKVEAGGVIEEVVNPAPTSDCGCGINFGTLKWCNTFYLRAGLWKCLLKWKDMATLCVPYNTDGKARCGRLTLLERVD